MEKIDRHTIKEGEHWAESIGVPGFPDGCHFEVRYRKNNEGAFIEGIAFVGPKGHTNVLKLLGVQEPRIVLEEGDAGFFPHRNEARVPAMTNLSDLLVALHEAGHSVQFQRTPESAHIAERLNSFVGIKAYLEQCGILILVTDKILREAAAVRDSVKEMFGDQCTEDDVKRAFAQKSLDPRILHLDDVRRIVLEQDVTRRILETFGHIEAEQGVDFSTVTLQNPVKMPEGAGRFYTMHKGFDRRRFLAALDVGLASHKADVPLYAICQRLFGDLCQLVGQNSEEIKSIRPLQADQYFVPEDR